MRLPMGAGRRRVNRDEWGDHEGAIMVRVTACVTHCKEDGGGLG
ncbi:hypothetical protein FHW96_002826 [Novosphingobium sp. SG751A]|nr:hypothetical protein [Novosphingobium sp. SG751A]NOW46666.1 hypothetical protein [Novosphingobium sp. SG751A]